MRPMATSTVNVDWIRTKEEVGELAKIGTFLSRDVLVAAPSQPTSGKSEVTIHSRESQFLETEIVHLLTICSWARNRTVDQIIDELRRLFAQAQYLTDKKPSEALGGDDPQPDGDPGASAP